MTRNRARKRAARQRAAATGERYVVANRHAVSGSGTELLPQKKTLHDFMHEIPGIPTHVDGGLQANVARTRNSNARAQRRHGRRSEARVLVAWQNWIARRVGAGPR